MKLPTLKYVKFTRAKGKTYAYFNTGRRVGGKLVFVALPPFGSVGFYDSYAACMGARTKSAQVVFTVADLCRAFELSEEFRRVSPGTQKTYGYTLARISDQLGKLAVFKVNRAHIREIVNHRIEGNGARNIFLKVVAILWKWARDRDYADATQFPTSGIAFFKMGEYEPWPEELLQAALASEIPRVRLAVHLLYYTGQRIGDVMKLRWSDLRNGKFVLTQQKTGKVLHIPLHSALERELAATPRAGITIITGAHGRPLRQDAIRAELKAFAAELGVKVVPHGLRKSAVNSLLEAGCTVHQVMSITGQSAGVVEHYARRVDQMTLGEAAIYKLEQKRPIQTGLQTGTKSGGGAS